MCRLWFEAARVREFLPPQVRSSMYVQAQAQPLASRVHAHVGARPSLADSGEALREAQRLRYEVFALEMGARLHNSLPGLDHDELDPHCQHLLVRHPGTGRVIACTRVLLDEGARRAGGFYSHREFDLDAVLTLPGRFAEVGRTCVHRDHRDGATITALWSGLASLVEAHQVDHLIGCASIPLGANGASARGVYSDLAQRHLSPEKVRVVPRIPLPRADAAVCEAQPLPPLLKAYLRLGAKICGEPFLDADFNVADLFILASTRRLARRYSRHFLERAA
jgi:putative hemolysin